MTAANTTPRFLPVGSEVAIKVPNRPAQWYKTVKEVDVAGEPTPALCPMNTGRNVLKTTYQGIDVFFLPHQMSRRATQQDIEHAQNLRFFLLDYDVPKQLPDNEDGDNFVHPSDYLPLVATRSTESCWIIPEAQIQGILSRLNRLSRVGGRWRKWRVDASDAIQALEESIASLQQRVDAAVASAQASLASATTQLNATPVEDDPTKAQKYYLSRVKQIQKIAKERLESAMSVANVFGVADRMRGVDQASSLVQAAAVSAHEQARVFVESVEAARAARTSDGAAVADATETGAMPVGVLADYLQEQGDDQRAGELRAAFGIVTGDDAAPVARDDQDGTFSLVGDDADVV